MTVKTVVEELASSINYLVETDMKKTMTCILKARYVCFFDTGFFTRLRLLQNIEYISDGFKRISQNDLDEIVFVLTETVLFELKDSKECVVQKENYRMLERLSEKGMRLVLLKEELVCDYLSEYMGKTKKEWNDMFISRLNENKANLTRLFTISLESDNPILHNLYGGFINDIKDTDFIENTIVDLKNHKKTKDSMAEELVVLTFFFLMELFGESETKKVYFCSHDLSSICRLNKVRTTSFPGSKVINVMTLFSFIEYLVSETIISDESQLESILTQIYGQELNVEIVENAPIHSSAVHLPVQQVTKNMIQGKKQIVIGRLR